MEDHSSFVQLCSQNMMSGSTSLQEEVDDMSAHVSSLVLITSSIAEIITMSSLQIVETPQPLLISEQKDDCFSHVTNSNWSLKSVDF